VPVQGNSRGAVRLVAEIAAVLAIGAGVVHISAAGDHTEVPVLFAGFIVVALLQLALGALLLWRRPSRPLVAAGLTLMVGSIGVWLVSRTAGLPFPEEGHQEPVGFKDGVTVLFELGAIPALLLLLSGELDRVALPSTRFASQTLRAVSGMCCVMLVPALMLGGGEHHSHEEAVALGLHDEGEGHAGLDGHALAQAGARHGHDDAHDANARKPEGHSHGGSSHTGGDDGHAGHTLTSAPLETGHEHVGGSEPGAPKHHAGEDGQGGHKDGGLHRDHPKGDGHRGGEHGGDHEGGHGEGGGQDDEPPISVSYEPLGVCVSAVCVP
jgi:hypothetical protein